MKLQQQLCKVKTRTLASSETYCATPARFDSSVRHQLMPSMPGGQTDRKIMLGMFSFLLYVCHLEAVPCQCNLHRATSAKIWLLSVKLQHICGEVHQLRCFYCSEVSTLAFCCKRLFRHVRVI